MPSATASVIASSRRRWRGRSCRRSGILLFGVGAARFDPRSVRPLARRCGVGAVAWGGRVLAAVPRNPSDRPRRTVHAGRPVAVVRGGSAGRQGAGSTGSSTTWIAGRSATGWPGSANRLDDGIDESWRIAKRGNDISDALARLDTVRTRDRARPAPRSALADRPPTAAAAKTIQSLEAQTRFRRSGCRRPRTTPATGCDCSTPGSTSSSPERSRSASAPRTPTCSATTSTGWSASSRRCERALEETSHVGHEPERLAATELTTAFEPPATGSSTTT